MHEALEKLQQERKQFSSSSELFASLKEDFELRKTIENLSRKYLRREVSGCSNCYFDAYIELANLKISTIMSESNFKLRNGAVLHDVVNLDAGKICTQLNITDELALYHLKTNPKCAKYFIKMPENVNELLENIKLPKEAAAYVKKNCSKTATIEVPVVVSQGNTANAGATKVEENVNGAGNDEVVFTDEEKVIINEMAEAIKGGADADFVKEEYGALDVIGEKEVTDELLDSLIEEAKKLIG